MHCANFSTQIMNHHNNHRVMEKCIPIMPAGCSGELTVKNVLTLDSFSCKSLTAITTESQWSGGYALATSMELWAMLQDNWIQFNPVRGQSKQVFKKPGTSQNQFKSLFMHNAVLQIQLSYGRSFSFNCKISHEIDYIRHSIFHLKYPKSLSEP